MRWKYFPKKDISTRITWKYLPMFILMCAANQLFGATYFVSPGGNDSYSSIQAQNPNTPWKTLKKAATVIDGGDTLVVKEGVYNESDISFTHSGRPNAWIVVKNEPESKPEITGTGNYGFLINGDKSILFTKSYFLISGLTFHGYQEDGISVYYADFVIMEKIDSYDNGNSGINTVGSNHIVIQDCQLHHNGWKSDGDSGWGDGASINNRELLESDQKWFSIVRRNVIYANWQKRNGSYWDGNGFTWDLAGTDGIHIMSGNIFFNNGGSGVLNDNTGNMAIIHNVLYRNMSDYNRCQNMGELYLTDQWVENTIMKNNIIFSRTRTAKYESIIPLILENADNNTTEIVENNLIWGELGNSTEIYWNSFMSLSSWKNRYAPTTITGSPGFVSAPFDNSFISFHNSEWIKMNVEDYNFQLNRESICIDKGTLLTVTQSDGSGTQIPVQSARCFTDGYGIKDLGDLIKVGSENSLRIQRIDYANNVLTVDKSISWKKGDGVSYPYYGNNPDIGVYEYTPLYYPQEEGNGDSVKTMFADISYKLTAKTKTYRVDLNISNEVKTIPTPLILEENDHTRTYIAISGNIPGSVFSGTFTVCDSISEGTGQFALTENSLASTDNVSTGNLIRNGGSIVIDKTPPAVPKSFTIAVLNN